MNNIEILKKKLSIVINLYNGGKFEDSIRKSRMLIKEYPRQIICYNVLSLSLMSNGENEEAVQILNRALRYESKNIHVLNNLGLAYYNLNDFKKSQFHLEECLNINSNFFDALINYGNLFLTLSNLDKALNVLNKALALANDSSKKLKALMAIGNCYLQNGDFSNAEKIYLKVLDINNSYTKADKAISLIKKYKTIDDLHFVNMRKKILDIKNEKDLKYLYFALGKAYEDINDNNKSFEYVKKGNDIEKKRINYQIKDDVKFFEKIKNFFSEKKLTEVSNSSKKIIFIVGMPRSGTTLTEQIISSHSKIYGAGELPYISDFLNKKIINKNIFDIKNSDDFFHNILIELRDEYFKKINALGISEKIIIDKAPLNFKWIGFIKYAFPNSKVINCDRDPMAICWSNYKNSFTSKSVGFSYDLNDLGKFYKLYKDLMNFWEKLYFDRIYNLKYETLVENKESEIKKILKFCELDWEENCLFPEKNKKIVSTASLSQIRSPIYKSSIKGWENYSDNLRPFKLELEKS